MKYLAFYARNFGQNQLSHPRRENWARSDRTIDQNANDLFTKAATAKERQNFSVVCVSSVG